MKIYRIKNIIKIFAISLFLSCLGGQLSYANSCSEDKDAMLHELEIVKFKYNYITTADGQHRFNVIFPPFQQDDNCFAKLMYSPGGRRDPKMVCDAKWIKGNWRYTINCI